MFKPKLRARIAWLPLRFGILNAAVMLLQLPVLIAVFDWSGSYSGKRIALLLLCVICGIVTINAPLQLLAALVAKRRWSRLATAAAVLSIHTICAAHRVRTNGSLDPLAAYTNAHITREAWTVAIDTLSGWMLIFGLVLLILIGHLELRRPIMRLQPGSRWRNALLCSVVYVGFLLAPLPLGDEVSRVAQASWHRRQPKGEFAVKLRPNEYPLIRATKLTPVPGAHHPDVFLLLVESFRADQVEKTSSNKKTYTPFFNELIKRGLYVERFYGNSIQTRKGQFAALCALIPSLSSSEFEDFSEKRLDCLPQVLKRQGYTTTFFQAYRDLSYDNTEQFMRRQGFAQVETVETYRHPDDDPYTWGWGLQDDKFYERFFEFLDKQDAAVAAKPQFVTLAPIGNHMHFNEMPQTSRKIYRNPKSPLQHYANSVYLADLGLREFFAQLERRPRFRDAVVIVTGDHSIARGEHGFEFNTEAAYEEYFRVPFLLVWPGVVKPGRVREIPYSQLDIAPTIRDIVGARDEQSQFMGMSLFEQPRRVHPIHLVQPYSGTYVSVVEYPYKYVFHQETGEEKLFDLVSDPKEEHDLAKRLELDATRAQLRRSLLPAFVVQAALEADKVWPHPARDPEQSAEELARLVPRTN